MHCISTSFKSGHLARLFLCSKCELVGNFNLFFKIFFMKFDPEDFNEIIRQSTDKLRINSGKTQFGM